MVQFSMLLQILILMMKLSFSRIKNKSPCLTLYFLFLFQSFYADKIEMQMKRIDKDVSFILAYTTFTHSS